MKYVLFYESADDMAAKAAMHFAAHSARWAQFRAEGKLLMVGPFEDAQADGAMGIFTSRQAAEEFAKDDPFVVNGVVRAWKILGWREALV